MLDRFKDDNQIQLISGRNCLFDGYDCDVSYYLSSYGQIWGWASWRRVWKTYIFDVNQIPRKEYANKLINRLPKRSVKYFLRNYDIMKERKVDTWDYQLCVNWFYFGRYCILPIINMIENIGLGMDDSTHTFSFNPRYSNQKSSSPFPLNHPTKLKIDNRLEYLTMINSGCYVDSIYVRILNKISSLFVFIFNTRK